MRGSKSSPVRDLLKYSNVPGLISLAGGIPAADLFDIEGLKASLLTEHVQEHRDAFQYGQTEGDNALKIALCDFLRSRGIDAAPTQLLTTTGSQQALELITRVFIDPGDCILVERPSYLAALQLFTQVQADIQSLPTDALEALETCLQQKKIKAICVVPNLSNPAGHTMLLMQRQRLVELAARYNVALVEDNPCGELRLSEEQLPTLYELAQRSPETAAHVILCIVVFQDSLTGIAHGVANRATVAIRPSRYRQTSVRSTYLHAVAKDRAALSRKWAPTQWLPKLIDAYRERRDALCCALKGALGEAITFDVPEGGMFLWTTLPTDIDTTALLPYAIAEKVVYAPGALFFANHPQHNALRLSYATISIATVKEAAHRLACAIEKFRAENNIDH